jgi:hypothetical protein
VREAINKLFKEKLFHPNLFGKRNWKNSSVKLEQKFCLTQDFILVGLV